MTPVLDKPMPVKMLLERRVQRGAEAAFTNWAERFVAAARNFPGHEGSSVFAAHDGWHVVLLRYATPEHLEGWQGSAEYRALIEEADAITDASEPVQMRSGLETWFTLPDMPAPKMPPAKWKMALVTWGCLLPLVLGVGSLLSPLGLPPLLETVVLTGICVSLLTWLIMPRATKFLYRWLYAVST